MRRTIGYNPTLAAVRVAAALPRQQALRGDEAHASPRQLRRKASERTWMVHSGAAGPRHAVALLPPIGIPTIKHTKEAGNGKATRA